MKPFAWNEEKNRLLKAERGISFEEVIAAIASGAVLDVVEHSNRERCRKATRQYLGGEDDEA
ncbi:hypothetical protein MTYM_01666 [Methylococcales bacterium]|nr:hypothetical protein MTYM_01666 [Methylococcales bacterium]